MDRSLPGSSVHVIFLGKSTGVGWQRLKCVNILANLLLYVCVCVCVHFFEIIWKYIAILTMLYI